jgi:hypothetical protein
VKISQREARRLRAQVKVREENDRKLRNGWLQEWPDGVHLLTVAKDEMIGEEDVAIVRTARRLGHPVMVCDSGKELHFFGVK